MIVMRSMTATANWPESSVEVTEIPIIIPRRIEILEMVEPQTVMNLMLFQ